MVITPGMHGRYVPWVSSDCAWELHYFMRALANAKHLEHPERYIGCIDVNIILTRRKPRKFCNSGTQGRVHWNRSETRKVAWKVAQMPLNSGMIGTTVAAVAGYRRMKLTKYIKIHIILRNIKKWMSQINNATAKQQRHDYRDTAHRHQATESLHIWRNHFLPIQSAITVPQLCFLKSWQSWQMHWSLQVVMMTTMMMMMMMMMMLGQLWKYRNHSKSRCT